MEIYPIKTPTLKGGDDLGKILQECGTISDGDIVVISSKAVATIEGAAIPLNDITVTNEAKELAEKTGTQKSLEHVQAILNETARMNGRVVITINGIMLTELKPDGFGEGRILVTNAGLDLSNVVDGYAIGWPIDPVASALRLREQLGNVGIIISDSGLCPRRKGVMAFALTVSGIDPIISKVGDPDIFGRNLEVTEEAVADQLATAGNFLMGNAGQSTPAATIRNHNLEMSTFNGWVSGIDPELDIFHGLI